MRPCHARRIARGLRRAFAHAPMSWAEALTVRDLMRYGPPPDSVASMLPPPPLLPAVLVLGLRFMAGYGCPCAECLARGSRLAAFL